MERLNNLLNQLPKFHANIKDFKSRLDEYFGKLRLEYGLAGGNIAGMSWVVIICWIFSMIFTSKTGLLLVNIFALISVVSLAYSWYKDLPIGEDGNKGTHVFIYMFSTYVILVLMFAVIYFASCKIDGSIIDTNSPIAYSFKDNSVSRGGGEVIATIPEYLYFSIVTSSTLGYGDLIPIGFPRLFVCIEVILFWLLIIAASIKLSVSVSEDEETDKGYTLGVLTV